MCSFDGRSGTNMGAIPKLPQFDGQKVIYCVGCLLGKDRLQAERILVRQTPYEIKVS
jgi:adenine-specific DNA-methyltransferase